MKVKLTCDEWWPVYSVTDHEWIGDTYEIPEDVVEELLAATERFHAVQHAVRILVENQDEEKR